MCKTIKQKVKFNAPPKVIYDLLADEKKFRAFTGKKANVSRRGGMAGCLLGQAERLFEFTQSLTKISSGCLPPA